MDRISENSQESESLEVNESVREQREITDVALEVRAAEEKQIESSNLPNTANNESIKQTHTQIFHNAEEKFLDLIKSIVEEQVPESEETELRQQLEAIHLALNKDIEGKKKADGLSKLNRLLSKFKELENCKSNQTGAYLYVVRTALTKEIENLRKERQSLREKLSEKEREYLELVNKENKEHFGNQNEQELIDTLRREKLELESKNIHLTGRIKQLQQLLNEYEQSEEALNKRFAEKEKALTEANSKLKHNVSRLTSELDELHQKEKNTSDQLIVAKQRISAYLQERSQQTNQQEESQTLVRQAYEEQKENLESELNKYKGEVSNLNDQLALALKKLKEFEEEKQGSKAVVTENTYTPGQIITAVIDQLGQDQILYSATPYNRHQPFRGRTGIWFQQQGPTSLYEELSNVTGDFEEDDSELANLASGNASVNTEEDQGTHLVQTAAQIHNKDTPDVEQVKELLEKAEKKYRKALEEQQKISRTLQNRLIQADESGNMASAELTRQIGVLFSRGEKKEILKYDGENSDVYKWIQEAERVANNNDWDSDQRIKFFSDRLEKEALEWHNEFMDKPMDNGDPPSPITRAQVTYSIWKAHFLKRFEDEADVERIKNRLKTLRQGTTQNVKSFIALINRLYDRVHGKGVKISQLPTVAEKALYNENVKLRDTEKKEILLSGLTRNVREGVWLRIPANAHYETVCKLACEVESILLNKELTENKGLTALVAGMTLHEQEQDSELKKQRLELANLQKQIGELRLTEHLSQGMDNACVVANVENYEPARTSVSNQGGNQERRFDRSNSRSRSADRNITYNRDNSGSVSPKEQRYSRNQGERTFYRNTGREERVKFNNNWRDRSQSSNRNQSRERNQFSFRNYRSSERPSYNRQNNARRDSSFNRPARPENQQNNRSEQALDPTPRKASEGTCFFCKLPGHRIRECRKRQRAERGSRMMNRSRGRN